MPALGMGLAWGSYALISWGYMLLRGYNVTFSAWTSPFHYYSGGWPPPQNIPAGSVLPTGGTAAAATATSKGKGTKAPPPLPVVPL